MQRFGGICHETSHESLVFLSDECDILWYTTRKRCITTLYHAIENALDDTISATYAQHTMERWSVIPSSIQQLSAILIGSFLWHDINMRIPLAVSQ